MYKQLGLVDLVHAIQQIVETNTGLRCYDAIPLNASAPFYYVAVTGKRPGHSKTQWRDIYTVNMHVIADGGSSVPVYEYIQQLEEYLTDDIQLPEPYELIMQTETGINQIMEDPTGEKHAIIGYEFMISYGLRCK